MRSFAWHGKTVYFGVKLVLGFTEKRGQVEFLPKLNCWNNFEISCKRHFSLDSSLSMSAISKASLFKLRNAN